MLQLCYLPRAWSPRLYTLTNSSGPTWRSSKPPSAVQVARMYAFSWSKGDDSVSSILSCQSVCCRAEITDTSGIDRRAGTRLWWHKSVFVFSAPTRSIENFGFARLLPSRNSQFFSYSKHSARLGSLMMQATLSISLQLALRYDIHKWFMERSRIESWYLVFENPYTNIDCQTYPYAQLWSF